MSCTGTAITARTASASGPWRAFAHRCYRESAACLVRGGGQIAVHRRPAPGRRPCDLFVALSEFASDRHAAAGIPRDRIRVKYNFVEDPGPRGGLPSGSDEVIFVGRDSPEKGLDRLLARWRRAKPRGLRLVVIGPIDPAPASGDDSVEFTGELEREAVMSRMLQARALTVPSRCPEGPSLAVFEAMAAGVPLVGSAVGGIEEVLRTLSGSTCVGVDDEPGWDAALGALADDELVDRGGEEARSEFERRFSPGRALNSLIGHYEQAIGRQHRAGRPRLASLE